ncbi:uracil DNA glycosylase superfamily protein [archaeon BMS3Abin16]|nr:uracil DNA glycosylase superfamily protein [archaeon BMS3Abin16]GBE55953.1 uracil DNA glycosylase superfamily protein [archaeon BMS3Bbin16]HDY74052.1 hypothetical protein [Euryarchaeota archaeon]
MFECRKCEGQDFRFKRNYSPAQFLEGRLSSKIWIVGINPKKEKQLDERDVEKLSSYFDDMWKIHSYFDDFKKVSKTLFEMFGKENGVAHTDLVKCSSDDWYSIKNKDKKAVISNCKGYLEKQLIQYKPKLIICNGRPVCDEIIEIIPPENHQFETCYKSTIDGNVIHVVLSGFIGRIDDYSKRRLGYEIERIMSVIGIIE